MWATKRIIHGAYPAAIYQAEADKGRFGSQLK
jgi:hypothetical protein